MARKIEIQESWGSVEDNFHGVRKWALENLEKNESAIGSFEHAGAICTFHFTVGDKGFKGFLETSKYSQVRYEDNYCYMEHHGDVVGKDALAIKDGEEVWVPHWRLVKQKSMEYFQYPSTTGEGVRTQCGGIFMELASILAAPSEVRDWSAKWTIEIARTKTAHATNVKDPPSDTWVKLLKVLADEYTRISNDSPSFTSGDLTRILWTSVQLLNDN